MSARTSFQVCQIAIAAWVVVFVATAAITLTQISAPPSLLLVVALAGCLGGVTNNYRRLQAPAVVRQLEEGDRSGKVFYQCLMSPLIGALFAIVAYLLFLTGMVEGALFPSFQGRDVKYENVFAFFDAIKPAAHADVAKALLWAVVAGFCESFVPNYLEKLARDEE